MRCAEAARTTTSDGRCHATSTQVISSAGVTGPTSAAPNMRYRQRSSRPTLARCGWLPRPDAPISGGWLASQQPTTVKVGLGLLCGRSRAPTASGVGSAFLLQPFLLQQSHCQVSLVCHLQRLDDDADRFFLADETPRARPTQPPTRSTPRSPGSWPSSGPARFGT